MCSFIALLLNCVEGDLLVHRLASKNKMVGSPHCCHREGSILSVGNHRSHASHVT